MRIVVVFVLFNALVCLSGIDSGYLCIDDIHKKAVMNHSQQLLSILENNSSCSYYESQEEVRRDVESSEVTELTLIGFTQVFYTHLKYSNYWLNKRNSEESPCKIKSKFLFLIGYTAGSFYRYEMA